LRLGACGRVAPDCYEDQLALKLERLRALFASGGGGGGGAGSSAAADERQQQPSSALPVPLPDRVQVFRSATANYRMRADFQVWFDRKSRREERLQAGAAANGAAAPAAATAAAAANAAEDEDDGVTDLYFIMHERVPVVNVEPEPTQGASTAKSSSDSEDGETEGEGDDDAEPARDSGSAAGPQPGNKRRRRRAFRQRRSQRPQASAPAGLNAQQQDQTTGAAAPATTFRMQRVRIDDFPAGSRLINSLMRLLRERLLAREPLRRRLFQANFHTTLSGEAMVTLVYHRALDDKEWRREAQEAREWLLARLAEEVKEAEAAVTAAQGGGRNSSAPPPPAPIRCTNLQLIGRCRGKRIDVDRNWIEEELVLRPLPFGDEGDNDDDAAAAAGCDAGGAAAAAAPQQQQQHDPQHHQRVSYRQVEMAFSQPNAGMCRKMLGWALDVTKPVDAHGSAEQQHDLLELYCGNGNFSVPLARHNFRRVLATEVSSTSVDAARHNAHANGLGPPPPPPATADGFDGQPEATDPPAKLFVARLSAEEFSETWRTGAARRRLEGLGGGGLSALDLRTALVDPPRAGLDGLTRGILLDRRFRRVVYVSCNPVTLKRDLALLTRGRSCDGGGGGGGAGAEEEAAAAPAQPYRIERFAVFDQFPYTEHLECGAYLVRDDEETKA
jgi:tRNA (uracil-5-)-methyltransferase